MKRREAVDATAEHNLHRSQRVRGRLMLTSCLLTLGTWGVLEGPRLRPLYRAASVSLTRIPSTKGVHVALFHLQGCRSCARVERLLNKVADAHPRLKLVKIDYGLPAGRRLYIRFARRYRLPRRKLGMVPTVFAGSRCFAGDDCGREMLEWIDKMASDRRVHELLDISEGQHS